MLFFREWHHHLAFHQITMEYNIKWPAFLTDFAKEKLTLQIKMGYLHTTPSATWCALKSNSFTVWGRTLSELKALIQWPQNLWLMQHHTRWFLKKAWDSLLYLPCRISASLLRPNLYEANSRLSSTMGCQSLRNWQLTYQSSLGIKKFWGIKSDYCFSRSRRGKSAYRNYWTSLNHSLRYQYAFSVPSIIHQDLF